MAAFLKTAEQAKAAEGKQTAEEKPAAEINDGKAAMKDGETLPEKQPREEEGMERLWVTADETVDWTEALAFSRPGDGLTGQKRWSFYHRLAPRVLKGEIAAYAEALKEGNPIYLIGDSAGGGLALAFAEYLRDNGTQLPQKLFLLSPWVDVTMSDPAIAEYEQKDLMLNSYGLIELGKLWAGELDTKDPSVSPLYGEMKSLPPTMIFTGTDEVMVPDNTTLYHKMREAGVDCSLIFGEGLWHVFVQDEIPEAVSARQMIVDACR
jgi:pimeloyl-ACP methyl ester carboxylesterase